MCIVILGGHDRLERQLNNIEKRFKVKIKFYNKGYQDADNALRKADYVIILTKLVSHSLTNQAKKLAKERCIFWHNTGIKQLENLIFNLKKIA